MKTFTGFLYSKLHAMGTKSEGPVYFLQISDTKDHPVVNQTSRHLSFMGDNTLHPLVGRKVRLEGDLRSTGIVYTMAEPLESEPSPSPTVLMEEWGSFLRQGAQGAAVLLLQKALRDRGYRIIPDGYFGTLTSELVKELQAANGLTPNGKVGLETWTALGNS